jgi:hypothetical protein
MLATGFVDNYIDDILTMARSSSEYVSVVSSLLSLLQENRVRLRLSKCKFGFTELLYAGYHLSGSGTRLDMRRMDPIVNFPVPSSVPALRRFLGLINQFRDYVPQFAFLVRPLTALLKKDIRFVWSSEAESSFLQIKNALEKSSFLSHIDYSKHLILRCDASEHGVGGVLLQINPAECSEEFIMFLSHAFSPQARKWSTMEQECYAIYYCLVEKLGHLLLGHEFTLETDHRNLLFLYRAVSSKLVRWRLKGVQFRS